MKKCGIYSIRNVVNNKIYVGSTNDINRRLKMHKRLLNAKEHSNFHLQSSWNKYGSDSFEFSVVEECNENMLIVREQAWINYYNSMNINKGYNLIGADRREISAETRQKLSEARRKRKTTEETKLKLSESGKVDWIKRKLSGYKVSEESRKKNSNSHIGRKLSEETKKNMSNTRVGRKMPEETKRKLSESQSKYWRIKRESASKLPVDININAKIEKGFAALDKNNVI